MSFQYRKRINLGKGFGVNLSRRGLSASYRSKNYSVGSRGFSIRTGIPGLSFRSSWGKGGTGLAILAITGLVYISVLIGYNLIRLICFLWKSGIAKLKQKYHSDSR